MSSSRAVPFPPRVTRLFADASTSNIKRLIPAGLTHKHGHSWCVWRKRGAQERYNPVWPDARAPGACDV